jgi:hypothetical protein
VLPAFPAFPQMCYAEGSISMSSRMGLTGNSPRQASAWCCLHGATSSPRWLKIVHLGEHRSTILLLTDLTWKHKEEMVWNKELMFRLAIVAAVMDSHCVGQLNETALATYQSCSALRRAPMVPFHGRRPGWLLRMDVSVLIDMAGAGFSLTDLR